MKRYTLLALVYAVLLVMFSYTEGFAESQDTIQVSLGGYVETDYGMSDTDIRGQISEEFLPEVRLYFDVTGMSPFLKEYGVHEYGMNIALGAEGSSVNMQEARLFFEHNVGTWVLGDTNGASDTLAVYAPVKTWTDRLDSDRKFFINRQDPDSRTLAQHVFTAIDSGRSTKITYYTPKMSGLQVGFSYTPEGGGSIVTTGMKGSLGNTVTTQDDQERFYDYLALGMRYEYSYDQYSFLVGVAGTRFSFTPDPALDIKGADYVTWQTGGQVTYTWSGVEEGRRLSFGGGFAHFGNYNTLEDGNASDEYDFALNVGLEYEDGPMTVGLGYYRVQGSYEKETTSIVDVIGLGWRYKLTEDLTLKASLTYYIFDIEGRDVAVFGFHDMDTIKGGTVVTAGLNLAF